LGSQTLEQFARNLKNAGSSEGVAYELRRLMAGMATEGAGFAQKNYHKNGLRAPTGNLKRSINGAALTGNQGIGIVLRAGDHSQVVYAAVHEFGFPARNIPARPYISPAIAHLNKVMPDDLRGIIHAKVLGRKVRPV